MKRAGILIVLIIFVFPSVIMAKSKELVICDWGGAGRAAEALHLSEVALAAAPDNDPALRAQLAAYEKLLEESNDGNHYEVFWLRDLIAKSRENLGISD